MKANHRSDLDEMSTLSVINLLPSNEAELASFKAKLKSEVITHPDALSVLKQLHWCLRTITVCLEDKDIKRRFYLEALCYGEEFFTHKNTNYEISLDSEDVKIEL